MQTFLLIMYFILFAVEPIIIFKYKKYWLGLYLGILIIGLLVVFAYAQMDIFK